MKKQYERMLRADIAICMLDQLIILNNSQTPRVEEKKKKTLNEHMDTVLDITGVLAFMVVPVSFFLMIWLGS